MVEKLLKIACPHCQQPVTWTDTNPFKPFCSERCKLIDLGDWASEKHRIPSDDTPALDDSQDSGNHD